MKNVRLSGGNLRFATYDDAEKRLELEFADGSRRLYKHVPHEVFKRLCAAPNAASYFEDRIREEYPQETLSTKTNANAKKQLDDLFG